MAQNVQQRLIVVFWLITGLASFTAFYVFNLILAAPDRTPTYFAMVMLLVVGPLILEALATSGLALGVFTQVRRQFWLRPGTIIKIFKFVSTVMDMAAIFDLVLRIFTGRIETRSEKAVLIIDGSMMILFILWHVVLYLINADVKERKVCDFC